MDRSVALVCLLAIACAGTQQKAASEEVTLLSVFEAMQIKGGEAGGFLVLNTAVGEDGALLMPRTSTERMDRFIHIWGEDGPAVPVSFSMDGAIMFSMLQGHAVLEQKLSEAEAAEWAWKTMHEKWRPEQAR